MHHPVKTMYSQTGKILKLHMQQCTVLTMVESSLSNDPSDLSVLMPQHFLTGDCLLAIPQAGEESHKSNLQPYNIVIVKDEKVPKQQWKLGRIKEIFPGEDGLVRIVTRCMWHLEVLLMFYGVKHIVQGRDGVLCTSVVKKFSLTAKSLCLEMA
ncbi:hypothetical protein PR048_020870, partial [Dryococelus australis]